jgi:hypothetical protein
MEPRKETRGVSISSAKSAEALTYKQDLGELTFSQSFRAKAFLFRVGG